MTRLRTVGIIAATLWLLGAVAADAASESSAQIDSNGTAHLAALDVPFSGFASAAARQAFVKQFSGPPSGPAGDADIRTKRDYYQKYTAAYVARARQVYPVD